MDDFEIHVTIRGDKAPEQTGWLISFISGDPCGKYIYTRHQTSIEAALDTMKQLVKILTESGIRVSRQKVEHVIFDERTRFTSFEATTPPKHQHTELCHVTEFGGTSPSPQCGYR